MLNVVGVLKNRSKIKRYVDHTSVSLSFLISLSSKASQSRCHFHQTRPHWLLRYQTTVRSLPWTTPPNVRRLPLSPTPAAGEGSPWAGLRAARTSLSVRSTTEEYWYNTFTHILNPYPSFIFSLSDSPLCFVEVQQAYYSNLLRSERNNLWFWASLNVRLLIFSC